MGYELEVQGQPTVKTSIQLLSPPDFPFETSADFVVLGMIITAMPAVNAITRVVAAAPGIATYNDLPLTVPRGVMNPKSLTSSLARLPLPILTRET